jgi:hypothetical protein
MFNPFSQDLRGRQAKIDQLKSALGLIVSGENKGQGSVTDKERDMFQKSIAALDQTQSDEDFRKELKRVQDTFNVAGQDGGAGGAVTMQSPDGKKYQVSPTEAADAEKNGWKRI